MPIRVLPPEVAAKIAAGEVVERPASVVKELVENALDAGATQIAVETRGGGLQLIRLADDGCGISPQEMDLAFARHATSKLASADDLVAIWSLGFRGEALPSIAAVADVEMVSRPADSPTAAYLKLIEGQVAAQGSRGAPVGTSITVRGLFARQPARRKFLRSPRAEAQHIGAIVSHYALAYPEVRFSLRLDDRQALLTPGSGDPRDAVAAVYDADIAAAMLLVASEGGPISVSGLVAPPQLSRASRGYISLFVNRRWVQNRRLAFAVEDAYQGLLMAGRHPIVVVDVRLPFEEVDVNVHPAKAEVRFQDESAVFAALQRAVRPALLEGTPVPAGLQQGAVSPATASSLSPQPTMSPLWEHGRALESRRLVGGRGPQSATAAPPPGLALPALRVIGQLGNTYVIAEGPDGMYLIDQHAAHERVLYQRLSSQRQAAKPEVQGLLEPQLIEPSPRQEAVLSQQAEALADHGFGIEPFGPRAYLLRALPALLAEGDVRRSVLEFLDLMLDEESAAVPDRVAMSLACHGAIRAGKVLSMEEMRELILQLEASEAPHTCPHGRPTMIHVSVDLLAREFGRR